jgi:hypothetical protein
MEDFSATKRNLVLIPAAAKTDLAIIVLRTHVV